MNQVVVTNKNYEGTEEINVRIFRCPICKSSNLQPSFIFCPYCGLKIKWKINRRDMAWTDLK